MSSISRIALIALVISPNTWAGADVLSAQGYGLVRFGMTVQEAELALKQHVAEPYSTTGCDYVAFRKYPGLRFMAEDGVITRADARRNIINRAKVRVGMLSDKVLKWYPSITVEPHKYDDNGHYLVLSTADGSAAIVMEEGNGKVTNIRAGLKPSVGYVEGCL